MSSYQSYQQKSWWWHLSQKQLWWKYRSRYRWYPHPFLNQNLKRGWWYLSRASQHHRSPWWYRWWQRRHRYRRRLSWQRPERLERYPGSHRRLQPLRKQRECRAQIRSLSDRHRHHLRCNRGRRKSYCCDECNKKRKNLSLRRQHWSSWHLHRQDP